MDKRSILELLLIKASISGGKIFGIQSTLFSLAENMNTDVFFSIMERFNITITFECKDSKSSFDRWATTTLIPVETKESDSKTTTFILEKLSISDTPRFVITSFCKDPPQGKLVLGYHNMNPSLSLNGYGNNMYEITRTLKTDLIAKIVSSITSGSYQVSGDPTTGYLNVVQTEPDDSLRELLSNVECSVKDGKILYKGVKTDISFKLTRCNCIFEPTLNVDKLLTSSSGTEVLGKETKEYYKDLILNKTAMIINSENVDAEQIRCYKDSGYRISKTQIETNTIERIVEV